MSFSKVLFIEDEDGAQELISRLLAMADVAYHRHVTFRFAKTWEEAEIAVADFRPDVVLADLALPPVHPSESVEIIRSKAKIWPPIVVITGAVVNQEELRKTCIAAGADDFLTKSRCLKTPECACERIYLAHLRRVLRDAIA